MRALITTTINTPELLRDYARDCVEFGHTDVKFYIAGDKKTPEGAKDFCINIGKKYDLQVEYMDVEAQAKYLDNVSPAYSEFLPWNCIQRRNVAILKAYRDGAEIIATIDDDNFLETKNYFGAHGTLGVSEESFPTYSTASQWFNPCRDVGFYPRGYSFENRGIDDQVTTAINLRTGKRVVNAGLWLGDPDIDAITRIALKPNVTDYRFLPRMLVLDINTKCPFNSQNTALHRSVISAYCLPTGLGRYDDIIASYIVKRIADHLGEYISFGLPLVKQNRNKHDLMKDLEDEMVGMTVIDSFVALLYGKKLTGTCYKSCTQELIDEIREYVTENGFAEDLLTDDQMFFMRSIVDNYTLWLEMFE